MTRSVTGSVTRAVAPARPAASSTVAAVALTVAGGLVLASCSADGGGTTGEPAASTSPSPTSTVSVPPSVSLTGPGSRLSFTDPASVVFEPNQKRGSVLELTVDRATRGSLEDFSAFILDDYTKSARPYYVDVTVKNVGRGDVGGAPVPLWGVDARDTLLPAATFTTRFTRCPSDPLPDTFAAGDSMRTCLVFLAPGHGALRGVSFRPDQDFDPIQWTGRVVAPKAAAPKPSPKPSSKADPKPSSKADPKKAEPKKQPANGAKDTRRSNDKRR